MADYRRYPNDSSRRHERDWSDRAADEVRTWFGDDEARVRRLHDERDDRYTYGGERPAPRYDTWRSSGDVYRDERSSGWVSPYQDRDRYAAATGSYRSDDRDYHQRYRGDRYRDDYRSREEYGSYGSGAGYYSGYGSGPSGRYRNSTSEAANDYYRAARAQRDDLDRWTAESPGAEEWGERGRGPGEYGYEAGNQWASQGQAGWRQPHAGWRPSYTGRGPKDYQRPDERVREEISDGMTDDPMLDASDITVVVQRGEVTLTGTVADREQKRRAEDLAERVSGVKDVSNQLRVWRDPNGYGHSSQPHTSSQPHQGTSSPTASASGTGTPSKSSSGSTT